MVPVSKEYAAEMGQLLHTFVEGMWTAACHEAARQQGAIVVKQPDSVTGLDASRIIFVELINDGSVVGLKPGWYGSLAGITGVPEVAVRYFGNALTFIPWSNVSNTRH